MDLDSYFRFVLALVFVLALIGVFAWLARRYGPGGGVVRNASKGRRLGVVEVAPLDGKRRLVLVRRDEVEHLVVLGAGSELVIERGITAPAAAEVGAGEVRFADALAERQRASGNGADG